MIRTSVTIHLPDDLLATIKSLAVQEERSRNQVICRLLNDALTLPRVVNGQGELRGFVATTPAITAHRTEPGSAPRGTSAPADLSIPAPTGDVMKDVPEVAARDKIPGLRPASSLPRPVTTDRPEFRGPIPKGGKK